MRDSCDVKQLNKTLENFEKQVQDACLPKPLTKNLVYLANKAQSSLSDGDICGADNSMAVAMQAIKQNLATDISLRTGFELSDTIMADIRPHIADLGVLAMDSAEFSAHFFDIYSNNPYRPAGIPKYMEKRPFPDDVEAAAENVLGLISSFELPDEQFEILRKDVDNFVKEAIAYCKDGKKADVLVTQNVLLTSIYYDMMDMQGSVLTYHQVMSVMGLIIFAAPPAWLCWSPPAIAIQILIAFFGYVGYRIYSAMKSAEAKAAYKRVWAYIESCKNSIKAAKKELKKRIKGLDAGQKKDVKDALKKTRKAVKAGKMATTGNKNRVLKKLDALIALL